MKIRMIKKDVPSSQCSDTMLDKLMDDYLYGRISHKNLKIQSGLTDVGVMDAMHALGYRKLIRVHHDDIEEQANHFVRIFVNSVQGQQAIAQSRAFGCIQ
jgi:hypothetical protein